MTGGVNPVVRGRRLAATLRRLRAESGRTIEDAAIHLECSAAKVSRMENGLVGVRIQDARELLDLYGVREPRREEILELVRQARGKGWWLPYTDVIPDGFDQVIGFEDEASVILMLEARLIPGLLQTERYASALIASARDVPPDVVERRIRLRLERQQILVRAEPARLKVVLDEAVLRRQIGNPELMADQYRRLIRAAQTPDVSLRVLPLAGNTHNAAGFSFTIFEFDDPSDPRVVYEEMYKGTVVDDGAELVGRYMVGFEQAQGCAWSENESLDFLSELSERPA